MREILKRMNVPLWKLPMIARHMRWLKAAREAGIAFGAVTWGYAAPDALRAHAPDMVFERMDQIAAALTAKARDDGR